MLRPSDRDKDAIYLIEHVLSHIFVGVVIQRMINELALITSSDAFVWPQMYSTCFCTDGSLSISLHFGSVGGRVILKLLFEELIVIYRRIVLKQEGQRDTE
jgi:hypothetical protein